VPTMMTSKETKVDSEPKVKKYRGLCSTCNNAPTCIYLKNRRPPVTQCEEFDDYSAKQPNVSVSNSPAPTITQADQNRETRVYKGLCVNCENRETCTLTKREGGIWHCEEYQ
jgi:hypothetical protein